MKELRIGIIGFGFIGKVHAYGHLNIPLFYDPCDFRSKIVKICTSRAETAAKAVAQTGAAKGVTDYREITEDPEIDVVDICTPNNLHCEAVLSAIAHQKHIYCDKPLTATLDEALRIEEALKGYNGVSQMTLHNRFFPITLKAKQMMADGVIGDVLEFRSSYLHSGSADPNAPLKWKLSAEAGGGVIADLGSHILDLTEHLIGPFDSLSAVTHIAYPDRPSAENPNVRVKVEVEDNMIATVRLASGAVGTVRASKIATGTEDEISFEIHGTKGALRVVAGDLHHLYYYDRAQPGKPIGGRKGWTAIDCGGRYEAPAGGFPTPKASIGWLRGHMHCLYNFLSNVSEGRKSSPDLARGIYVQRLMERVREAAASGTWVKIN